MECLCYCVAEAIDLSQLEKAIKATGQFHWERTRNVAEISLISKQQILYVFKNGTIISWNIRRHEIKSLLKLIKEVAINGFDFVVRDEFSYTLGTQTKLWPHDYFNVECLELENDDKELKLALSYGLSNSIKLNRYEHQLERQISKYLPYIKQGSKKKALKVSRKEINIILREIIATKSQVNLSSEILYQPKFFWKHPNLEEYYRMIEKYLDMSLRIDIINMQVETLNEIFGMFNSYLVNRHSHNLELIIIILIIVEIVFNFLNLHLN